MKNHLSAIQVYACNRKHSYIIRALVHLKDEISFDALRYAVDTSIKRYPYLSQRIVSDAKGCDLVFLPNEVPICIFHDLDEHLLSSKETNYHIQYVSYEGNTICFDISHGFADGQVLTEWIKTVLYYYLTKKYNLQLDPTYIRTVEEPVPGEELIDPLKPYVDELIGEKEPLAPVAGVSVSPARIADFYPITPGAQDITFRVDAAEFMRFAKTNDGSLAIFAIALIAKILHERNSSIKAPMLCETVMNYKGALNAPNSHATIVAPAETAFPAGVLDRNLETLTIMVRGKIIASQYEPNVKAAVNNLAKVSASVLSLPTIEMKKQVSLAAIENARSTNTFGVSYPGKTSFCVLEEYMESLYFMASNDPSDLFITIASVGSKSCFSMMQTFCEEALAKDFVSCLEKNGVKVEEYASRPLQYPKVAI